MQSEGSGPPGSPEGAGPPGGAGGAPLHARSFKLRFAAQREPGRSYVSLVKPRGLPATVADKFYRRSPPPPADDAPLRAVRELFERGPKDVLPAPLTTSHEYGWWAARARPADGRLRHHIRDSAWLKARLRVLAADDKLHER